jgi:hypothetical protein
VGTSHCFCRCDGSAHRPGATAAPSDSPDPGWPGYWARAVQPDQIKLSKEGRRIDGPGECLMPGLADMQVHLSLENKFETYSLLLIAMSFRPAWKGVGEGRG